MAIVYPTTIDSFTDKADNVDDVQAVDINDVQDACEALEAKVGVTSSAVVTSVDYLLTRLDRLDKVWIYANVAPTGWNIVASTSDALIACKGGSNAYNTTGGQQIGTWTQPNHTHTGPNHTHIGGSHSLSIAELAAHTHPVTMYYGAGGTATHISGYQDALPSKSVAGAATTTGSGTAHSHGNTGAGGTGATGGGATAATFRPLANLGITIEKA